ncbi:MAG: hypothetical protein ABWJ99_02915, partial [Caldimicrobium sp.]
ERTEDLERVLIKCAENGWILEVKKIADLLPEPKRSEELEKALISCLKKGDAFIQAKEIAKLLPEPLKTQYLETLKEPE